MNYHLKFPGPHICESTQVPLEHYINIAVNGPFWVEVMNPEHLFMAMLISRSRGTCLIEIEVLLELNIRIKLGFLPLQDGTRVLRQ